MGDIVVAMGLIRLVDWAQVETKVEKRGLP